MSEIDFEKRWQQSPEGKLELISGRLIVGNSIDGSRYLLHDILDTWTPDAAIPFAERSMWLSALVAGFASFEPPEASTKLSTWRDWAKSLEYSPQIKSAGPRTDRWHQVASRRLRTSLWESVAHPGHAYVFGPDCAIRINDDVLTPDLMIIGPERAARQRECYLDGPADVLIEIVLRGHEDADRGVKRDLYARSRTPEYWIVDPYEKRVEYLRLREAGYERFQPDDSAYRPQSLPWMAFHADRLFAGIDDDEWGTDRLNPSPLTFDDTPPTGLKCAGGGVEWGDLAFDPQPGLQPRPLRFREFVSWCGRAKFEMVDGKPLIDGHVGTREVLGMLLRTFGLTETVRLMHPFRWINALENADDALRNDAAVRDKWWSEVHSAARLLHERYGLSRISVIGDLVRDKPLNMWSGVTLVLNDVPKDVSLMSAYDEITKSDASGCIHDLRDDRHFSRAQKEEFEAYGVEV